MARTPRVLTTIALLAMTGGALFLGADWTLANPLAHPNHPIVRPPVEPPAHHIIRPIPQPRLDVAFVLDTTGSMADEIAVVKDKIRAMASELLAGQPRPDVRFALVCYRDRGDAYVTQTFPFTRDIGDLHRAVLAANADGGGDTPESVNEALDVALNHLQWSTEPYVSRQIFLIGDAGPHTNYRQGPDYRTLARTAAERRITIDSISCSGMDGFGVGVWEHVAKATNGRFEYLTYAQVMRQTDGSVKTYLKYGDETYEPADEVREADWRKAGAAGLVAADKARVVAPSRVTGTPVGGLKNNLDSVMVERLKQRAAEEQGVEYASD